VQPPQPQRERSYGDENVIIDAQIRAERMAVRLKLQSAGATQRVQRAVPQQVQAPVITNIDGAQTTLAASSSRAAGATASPTEAPSLPPLSSSLGSANASAGLGYVGSLDAKYAAIVAAAGSTGGAKSSARFEEERAAVRTRLERFSINRYAFVNNGANAGRVIDRVTGEVNHPNP
jgi:hypothetical protein